MKYPKLESQTREFKEEIPKSDQVVKTVIGFCNQSGGQLIIGVADDGTIVGLDENEVMQTMEWLEHSIYEACAPPILPSVQAQRIGDKVLLVINVSPGMNKPYYRNTIGKTNGVLTEKRP